MLLGSEHYTKEVVVPYTALMMAKKARNSYIQFGFNDSIILGFACTIHKQFWVCSNISNVSMHWTSPQTASSHHFDEYITTENLKQPTLDNPY